MTLCGIFFVFVSSCTYFLCAFVGSAAISSTPSSDLRFRGFDFCDGATTESSSSSSSFRKLAFILFLLPLFVAALGFVTRVVVVVAAPLVRLPGGLPLLFVASLLLARIRAFA